MCRARARRGTIPEDRALIQYRCIADTHQTPKAGTSDTLTVYQGKWAYCPFDVRAKGHTWEDTGALSLNEVRMLVDRKRNARAKAAPD